MSNFQCPICFTELGEDTPLGQLDCGHCYCFPCIREWLDSCSSCPLCKHRVQRLLHHELLAPIPASGDGAVLDVDDLLGDDGVVLASREVAVEQKDLPAPEPTEADVPLELCEACHEDQDDDLTLLCDSCSRAYHTYCVGLDEVPTGRWFCPACDVLDGPAHCRTRQSASVSQQDPPASRASRATGATHAAQPRARASGAARAHRSGPADRAARAAERRAAPAGPVDLCSESEGDFETASVLSLCSSGFSDSPRRISCSSSDQDDGCGSSSCSDDESDEDDDGDAESLALSDDSASDTSAPSCCNSEGRSRRAAAARGTGREGRSSRAGGGTASRPRRRATQSGRRKKRAAPKRASARGAASTAQPRRRRKATRKKRKARAGARASGAAGAGAAGPSRLNARSQPRQAVGAALQHPGQRRLDLRRPAQVPALNPSAVLRLQRAAAAVRAAQTAEPSEAAAARGSGGGGGTAMGTRQRVARLQVDTGGVAQGGQTAAQRAGMLQESEPQKRPRLRARRTAEPVLPSSPLQTHAASTATPFLGNQTQARSGARPQPAAAQAPAAAAAAPSLPDALLRPRHLHTQSRPTHTSSFTRGARGRGSLHVAEASGSRSAHPADPSGAAAGSIRPADAPPLSGLNGERPAAAFARRSRGGTAVGAGAENVAPGGRGSGGAGTGRHGSGRAALTQNPFKRKSPDGTTGGASEKHLVYDVASGMQTRSARPGPAGSRPGAMRPEARVRARLG